MGLCIELHFADGTIEDVHMCYSSFSGRVMTLEDMEEYGFTDHDGEYTGRALEFLIERLEESGYLAKKKKTSKNVFKLVRKLVRTCLRVDEPLKPAPILARFC